jgi:hypothetical protein
MDRQQKGTTNTTTTGHHAARDEKARQLALDKIRGSKPLDRWLEEQPRQGPWNAVAITQGQA